MSNKKEKNQSDSKNNKKSAISKANDIDKKNSDVKKRTSPKEKYYYVSVRYDDTPDDSFPYRYISTDLSIKLNDRVLVPRGDSHTTGHVVECQFYTYDKVPYPVEYTKYVIKKIDENYKLSTTANIDEAGSFYDQLCTHIVIDNGVERLDNFDVEKYRNKPSDSNIKYTEGFEENIIPCKEDKDLQLFILGIIKNLDENNIFQSVHKVEDFLKDSDHYIKDVANEAIDELISILNGYSQSINKKRASTTIEKNIISEKNRAFELYFQFAMSLILYPKNIEAVKLGISLIGIYKYSDDEEIMELFSNLSLCEELAKYMAFLYSNQESANKLLLEAAKKTYGWGRINYIEKFNFSNYELLDWFLMEGYKNAIDSLYTSNIAAKRIDLISILNDSIDLQYSKNKKEASKAKRIIQTILRILADLNEEPNTFEDFEEENSLYPSYNVASMIDTLLELREPLQYYPAYYQAIIAYINYLNAKTAVVTDEYYETQFDSDTLERINQIDEIMGGYDIDSTFKTIVKKGSYDDCDEICKVLINFPEIDVANELMEKFSEAPTEMFLTFSYLMYNEEYRDQAYEIMKKSQDWEMFRGEPQPVVDSQSAILKYVIGDLGPYPFYETYFINLGLNSYDCYCRYAALSVLLEWKSDKEIPIYKFPTVLLESLIKLKTKEVMKDNKELLIDLLADLKDLQVDAKKAGNVSIIKIIDIFTNEEDLKNYKEPKIIYK